MTSTPTVLFLQAHPSTFAVHVADEITRLGGRALRINLCGGDVLMWRRRGAVSYRGRLEDWPQFLRDFVAREGVTDLVYYADRHPYHRAAAAVAREQGLRASTYEFGYLRPDWITLERGGMSAWSHFPRDPAVIRAIAAQAPEPDLVERYTYTFRAEAIAEVSYNLAMVLGRPFFPHYRTDKYYHPVLDYLAYIPQLVTSRSADRRARGLSHALIADGTPFFLVPMQMQNDYQLRANSPFRHQSHAIEDIVASFAVHAEGAAHLVFKVHPLDNGLERWSRRVAAIAEAHGVSARVHLIRGGDLKTLITSSAGVIVVNSTVGVHALRHGTPVKVLGAALYDIAGLTHQGPLDAFWAAPPVPDAELCWAFVKALASTIQVKGNFFTREGRAAAVSQMARRIVEGRVNEPSGFVAQPPRLLRAAAMGLPLNLHEAVVAAGLNRLPETGDGRARPEPASDSGDEGEAAATSASAHALSRAS